MIVQLLSKSILKNALRSSIIGIAVFSFTGTQIFAKPRIWIEARSSMFVPSGAIITDTGKSQVTGMFETADITALVADNKEAHALAQLANDADTSGKIWFWSGFGVGLGGIITGLAIMDYKRDSVTGDSSIDYSSSRTNAGLIVAGISCVWYVVGILVGTQKLMSSKHYLFKSINTYNGVYEKTQSQSALPTGANYFTFTSNF